MADDQMNPKPAETSEAQIAVHWKEEEYFFPSKNFVAQANLTDPGINERFGEQNFPKCFEEYANMLDWYETWHTVLDSSDPPFWKWFGGGKLNWSAKTRFTRVSCAEDRLRLSICSIGLVNHLIYDKLNGFEWTARQSWTRYCICWSPMIPAIETCIRTCNLRPGVEGSGMGRSFRPEAGNMFKNRRMPILCTPDKKRLASYGQNSK